MPVETRIRRLAIVALTCAAAIQTAFGALIGRHFDPGITYHIVEDEGDTVYLGVAFGSGF